MIKEWRRQKRQPRGAGKSEETGGEGGPAQRLRHRFSPECVPCMVLERTMWRNAMRGSLTPDVVSVHFP